MQIILGLSHEISGSQRLISLTKPVKVANNTANHVLRQCDLPWIGARTLIGPACSSLLQGGAAPPLHHVGDGAGEPPLALALHQQQLLSGPLLLNLRSDFTHQNRIQKVKKGKL